jgi:hypothetical protein
VSGRGKAVSEMTKTWNLRVRRHKKEPSPFNLPVDPDEEKDLVSERGKAVSEMAKTWNLRVRRHKKEPSLFNLPVDPDEEKDFVSGGGKAVSETTKTWGLRVRTTRRTVKGGITKVYLQVISESVLSDGNSGQNANEIGYFSECHEES